MDEELRKILGEVPEATPPAETPKEPEQEKPKEPETPSAEDQEKVKKAEQLSNLNKAISEAQGELKKVRKAKKEAGVAPEEEELPKINMEDPSAKAWDRHIRENVAPLNQELEKEKEEVRSFALREFLADKPNLAKDPEKLKAVISTYDRIKTASERTREGVLLDLDKAYAAEHYQEILGDARQKRMDAARNDAAFSDIGVSRGSTAYSNPSEVNPSLSEDDRAVLAKWGMTPADWITYKKKYG